MLTHPFKSTRQGALDYVFDFFIEVVKPEIFSIMPMYIPKDVKNGYYIIDAQNKFKYRSAIQELMNTTQYDPKTQTGIFNIESFVTLLLKIQLAKAADMARVARETLAQSRGIKVIFFADYYDVIDILLERLAEFNPVELTGRISENARYRHIDLFNQPDQACRVLIGNPVVGGMCINLHDTTGNFPRVMYIMPGYRINELQQATGRIARDGLIGEAKVRFFYGYLGKLETNILTALIRKGKDMERLHEEQKTIFPNRYPSEYEDGLDGNEDIGQLTTEMAQLSW